MNRPNCDKCDLVFGSHVILYSHVQMFNMHTPAKGYKYILDCQHCLISVLLRRNNLI